MWRNHFSFAHALAYGAIGVALVVLVSVSTTLANAAPGTEMTTTAAVHSKTVNVASEPCRRFPLRSGSRLQAYIDAAEVAQQKGTSICLAADQRLTVAAPLTVSAPAVLDFNGATIVEDASLDGWLITVNSPGVSILHVTLRGNRSSANEGGGLLCEAAGCQVSGVEVTKMTTTGILVRYPTSSLDISSSSVVGTFSPKPSAGNGILVASGALLQASDTSATGNSGNGFRLVKAAAGSYISGSSSNNLEAGISTLEVSDLRIGTFVSKADWHYGIVMSQSSDVRAGFLTVVDTGAAQGSLPLNGRGAAVALVDVTGSTFTNLHLTGMPGYGLSLAGASKNLFVDVRIARDGKGETNPGVNLDHGSADNTWQTVSITNTSVGVDIGSSGVKNDRHGLNGNTGNLFETLTLVGDRYAAISIQGGKDNVFTLVNATDIGSDYPAPAKAAVRLLNATTNHNTIVVYNTFVDSEYPTWDTPLYLVYADSKANHNSVALGTIEGGYSTAKWHQGNPTNTFT
jgi:hypothetical protein